jgi:hypothetical protein
MCVADAKIQGKDRDFPSLFIQLTLNKALLFLHLSLWAPSEFIINLTKTPEGFFLKKPGKILGTEPQWG